MKDNNKAKRKPLFHRTSNDSKDNNKRKWRRLSMERPAFMDSLQVIAPSPFGASRLQEIKSLYQATIQNDNNYNLEDDHDRLLENGKVVAALPEQSLRSSGGKISSRHLRRRTTSFRRRIRHRYPNQHNNNSFLDKGKKEPNQIDGEEETLTKKLTRKARRGIKSKLCESHFTWYATKNNNNDNNNMVCDSSIDHNGDSNDSNSIYCWLRSHLWLVKRFHMMELFGWKIPMVHTNRGARAIHRLATTKPWLYDASWKRQPIIIEFDTIQLLINTMKRSCPDITVTSNINQVMIHEVDQFPSGAIGPMHYRIVYQRNNKKKDDSDNDENNSVVCLWIMAHPAIRSTIIHTVLQKSLKIDSTKIKTTSKSIACLQICGKNATQAIQSTLSPKSNIQHYDSAISSWDWDQLSTLSNHSDADLCHLLPHGTIIPTSIEIIKENLSNNNTTSAAPTTNESKNQEDLLEYIQSKVDKVSLVVNDYKKMLMSLEDEINDKNILLICHRPNELIYNNKNTTTTTTPYNGSMCGWEIWCDPNICQDIFHPLSQSGGACVIGEVEYTHMCLECHPPLPVFPRDYIDTEHGQEYWNAKTENETSQKKSKINRWAQYRHWIQGGWGKIRLPTENNVLFSNNDIDWSAVVTKDDDSQNQTNKISIDGTNDNNNNDKRDSVLIGERKVIPVMVRGTVFGTPFQNAISGCANLPPKLQNDNQIRRRPRRPIRQANEITYGIKLSHQELINHHDMCRSLLGSLSLPAVLSCHVEIFGKGTVSQGMEILLQHTASQKMILLGYVTAGGFSVSRGSCHGIGIIGASRLLQSLMMILSSSATHNNYSVHSIKQKYLDPGICGVVTTVFAPRKHVKRQINLLVHVRCSPHLLSKAALSLLL